jgi:hypothetical protein
MLGRLDVAKQRLEAARNRSADEPLLVSLYGMLHARRQWREDALACINALLGDTDKAFAWLERSADTRNPCWPFFRVDPHLDSLRSHEWFQRLVSRLERESMAIFIRGL